MAGTRTQTATEVAWQSESLPGVTLPPEGDSRPEPRQGPEAPAVGANVWFLHWSFEWVKAVIVDGIRAADNDGLAYAYSEPAPGTVHLRIELNRRRHFSANNFGYRRDVEQGTTPGHWLPEPPANWQAIMSEMQMRKEIWREARLAIMREQTDDTPDMLAARMAGRQAVEESR